MGGTLDLHIIADVCELLGVEDVELLIHQLDALRDYQQEMQKDGPGNAHN